MWVGYHSLWLVREFSWEIRWTRLHTCALGALSRHAELFGRNFCFPYCLHRDIRTDRWNSIWHGCVRILINYVRDQSPSNAVGKQESYTCQMLIVDPCNMNATQSQCRCFYGNSACFLIKKVGFCVNSVIIITIYVHTQLVKNYIWTDITTKEVMLLITSLCKAP